MIASKFKVFVIGNVAFLRDDFVKSFAQEHDVSYLPDVSTCLAHAKNRHSNSNSAQDIYIFSDFGDPLCISELVSLRPKARIMGVPAFLQWNIENKKWSKSRPIFTFSMHGAVVCITGFRDKITVVRIWIFIFIQESFGNSYQLDGGQCAALHACISYTSCCLQSLHRARVFQNCRIAFIGFAPCSDELRELISLATEHDGEIVDDLDDPKLTHVVVTDSWPGHAEIMKSLSRLVVANASVSSRLSWNPISPVSSAQVISPYSGVSYLSAAGIGNDSFSSGFLDVTTLGNQAGNEALERVNGPPRSSGLKVSMSHQASLLESSFRSEEKDYEVHQI
ncbi:unnamed protein product [Protopolystoma xenopodis]|uniref:BRCT domain-containing protein n=1 Tax=Protopolystoma xenopodis TaxID=117903 RepID=A0A3S5C7J0_9PLAT|nr:unnamed protein product [Protopolystoma xenopodis]